MSDSQRAGRARAPAEARDMLSAKGVLAPGGGGGIWRTCPVTFHFKQVIRANSSAEEEDGAKFQRGGDGR